MIRVLGALLAALVVTASARADNRPLRHDPMYCPTDRFFAIPKRMGVPTRFYVPCRDADRIRRMSWRV